MILDHFLYWIALICFLKLLWKQPYVHMTSLQLLTLAVLSFILVCFLCDAALTVCLSPAGASRTSGTSGLPRTKGPPCKYSWTLRAHNSSMHCKTYSSLVTSRTSSASALLLYFLSSSYWLNGKLARFANIISHNWFHLRSSWGAVIHSNIPNSVQGSLV